MCNSRQYGAALKDSSDSNGSHTYIKCNQLSCKSRALGFYMPMPENYTTY